MADYTYSISQDLPGGVFTSTISAILSLLCRDFITGNSLDNIGTAGDDLTLTFQSTLTAPDKTILDGDTLNPAGGLIARSTDDYSINFEDDAVTQTAAEQALEPYPTTEDQLAVFPDSPILLLPPDGITITTITIQYTDFSGTDGVGYGNRVELVGRGLFPQNIDVQNFDGTGKVEFIVGPSFDFGVIELPIFAAYLPFKAIQIRFGMGHDL